MSCIRCGNCCHSQAGWLQPEDLTRIAQSMDITTDELIHTYLIIDYLPDPQNGYLYAYAPVKVNEFTGTPLAVPGQRVPWRYTEEFAPCIFLTSTGCGIHPMKPTECRLYECNQQDAERNLVMTRKEMALRWDQTGQHFSPLHARYPLSHCLRNLDIEGKIQSIAKEVAAGRLSPDSGWEKIDNLKTLLD